MALVLTNPLRALDRALARRDRRRAPALLSEAIDARDLDDRLDRLAADLADMRLRVGPDPMEDSRG